MANINTISPDGGTTIYDIEDTPARSGVNSLTPRVGIVEGKVSTLEGQMLSVEDALDALGTASTKNSTSVVTESSDLVESGAVKDIVGWGNKNNLSIPASVATQSKNGIDFTFHRNSDGAVTKIDVVGTATSDSRIAWFIPDTFVQGETYKLTGWDVRSITQGKTVNFAITFGGVQGSIYILNATETEKEYTCNKTGYTALECAIFVQNGTTIDATLYPMNRKATVTDPTFEPYHASVSDSLAEKADTSVIAPVENGTTTSRAYAVGSHAIRNGAFITWKNAKAQGEPINDASDYTNGDVAQALDTISDTFTTTFTLNSGSPNYVKKKDNAVYIAINLTGVTANTYDVLATIPSGFRPAQSIIIPIVVGDNVVKGAINSNGIVICTSAITNTLVYINANYIL